MTMVYRKIIIIKIQKEFKNIFYQIKKEKQNRDKITGIINIKKGKVKVFVLSQKSM
jgi:hypothetical protein